MKHGKHRGTDPSWLASQDFDGEPFYCEAPHDLDEEEVWYSGSEDDAYDSPAERRARYEDQARRFVAGEQPFVLSAGLQGPFGSESGWRNPWRSGLTKKRSNRGVVGGAGTDLMQQQQNEKVPATLLSYSMNDPATESPEEQCQAKTKTKIKRVKSESLLYQKLDSQQTRTSLGPMCIAESFDANPVSSFVDDDSAFVRIESWRDHVTSKTLSRDKFWASTPTERSLSATRKRAASTDWLRGKGSKKRRSDRLSMSSSTHESAIMPTPSGPYHQEDESESKSIPVATSAGASNRATEPETIEISSDSSSSMLSSIDSFELDAMVDANNISLKTTPSGFQSHADNSFHYKSKAPQDKPEAALPALSDIRLSVPAPTETIVPCTDAENTVTDPLDDREVPVATDAQSPENESEKENDKLENASNSEEAHGTEPIAAEAETGVKDAKPIVKESEPLVKIEDASASALDIDSPASCTDGPSIMDDTVQAQEDLTNTSAESTTLVDGSTLVASILSPESQQSRIDELGPISSDDKASELAKCKAADVLHHPSQQGLLSEPDSRCDTPQFLECGSDAAEDPAPIDIDKAISEQLLSETQSSWSGSGKVDMHSTSGVASGLSQNGPQSPSNDTDKTSCELQLQADTLNKDGENVAPSGHMESPLMHIGDISRKQSPWTKGIMSIHQSSSASKRQSMSEKRRERLSLAASGGALASSKPQSPWAKEDSQLLRVTRPSVRSAKSPPEACDSIEVQHLPHSEDAQIFDSKLHPAQSPTPEDVTNQSGLLTPDFTMSIQLFDQFLSPSPERRSRVPGGILLTSGRLPSTQALADAMANPWDSQSSSHKTVNTKRKRKRVSFAPLPGEKVDIYDISTALQDDNDKENNNNDDDDDDDSPPQKTRRAASPPLPITSGDLPSQNQKFGKHFAAVAESRRDRIRNAHRRTPQTAKSRPARPRVALLPSESQQMCASPAVEAMAEAFIDAERPIGDGDHGSVSGGESAGEPEPAPRPEPEPIDDVSVVMENLDSFINGWDMDAELNRLEAERQKNAARKDSSSSPFGLVDVDVGVWD